MHPSVPSNLRGAVGAIALMLLSAAAMAAPANGAGSGQGASEAAARAQEIRQALMQIQSETLEANPELAQRQEAIADMVQETMRENGHTPEADVEKLNEIRQTLQSGDVGQQERRTLVQEFRELRAEFVGAQRTAASEPEIREEQQSFQRDLLVAMQEQDSRTRDLIEQMNQLRNQMTPGG